MKKKISYLILIVLMIFPSIVLAADLNYVACGNAKSIPAPVPQLTSIAYTLLIIGTPLILIIFSIVALVKAITGGSQDDILKAKNKVIKKFIAAAIVFAVAGIAQFVIVKAGDASETGSITDCIECFLYNSGCMPSGPTDDAYQADTRPGEGGEQQSNPGNQGNNSSNGSNNATSAIFVGDSRTVGMCQYNNANLNVGVCRDYLTVSQQSIGMSWFNDTAISNVNTLLSQNSSTVYDIVILLGVNDIGSQTSYADSVANGYISSIQTQANGNWKNHNIIFTSIAPIGSTTAGNVSQTNIDYFNSKMKSGISALGLSNVSYCDISSINLTGKFAGDNLHFTPDGYTTLYNQVVSKCL